MEWLTIGWTALAGVAGFTLGIRARSVSLTAFGLDSVVEFVCAAVLLQRLAHEHREGAEKISAAELQAARIVGFLLLAAALYVTIEALWHLSHHTGPTYGLLGIALTIATIPIMVALANAKLTIAHHMSSRALRADAIGNVACWYLACVVLASVLLDRLFHWWWLDGAASLLIVILLAKEGAAAWRAQPL